MKKYIKLLSVCLLTVIMCLSFCSCKELDEMRDDQAIWGKTEQTLYFRDAEYKLLPACNDLSLVPGGHGYVTDSDVPVLLSSSHGDRMSYDRDAIFVVYGYWANKSECNKVWCRTDKYEEVCAAIESYEMNRYCVWNPKFEDGYYCERYTSLYTILPAEVSDIIDFALATEGEKCNDDYGYSEWNGYGNYIEDIYACDETLQFVNEQSMHLACNNDGEYVILKLIGDDWYRYSISAENAKTLAEIIENTY